MGSLCGSFLRRLFIRIFFMEAKAPLFLLHGKPPLSSNGGTSHDCLPNISAAFLSFQDRLIEQARSSHRSDRPSSETARTLHGRRVQPGARCKKEDVEYIAKQNPIKNSNCPKASRFFFKSQISCEIKRKFVSGCCLYSPVRCNTSSH